jgi:transcriptional regulator with PAS, ATPase and Fis domain
MTELNYLEKSIKIATQSDSIVLITGATGTGKTSLAKEIHEKSLRKSNPFIHINLATLHEGTFESELFGHERGSFTGADKRRAGRLQIAQGGTVFLDEVGELSQKMQAKLLEFLQSKTIFRIGANESTYVNARVIAATHKNLTEAVKNLEFRADLLQRLKVITLELKELKERMEDFSLILHKCLNDISSLFNVSVPKIDPQVIEKFHEYAWPGNIRELKNILEYAIQSSENDTITYQDLPLWFQEEINKKIIYESSNTLGTAEIILTNDFYATSKKFEKEYVMRALKKNKGMIGATARYLRINQSTLIRKIRILNIYSSQANN